MSPAMKTGASVVIIGLAIGIATLTVVELARWRRDPSVITLTQLVVRLIGSALLLGLLAMLLGGVFYVNLDKENPKPFVYYWSGCIGLAGLVWGVAVVDFWLVAKRRREKQRELQQQFAQTLREWGRAAQSDGAPPDASKDKGR